MRELLTEQGILFAHFDDNVAHEVKSVLDEVFGPDKRRGEIVWALGTGAKSRKFCSIQHNLIFAYSAGDEWQFDADAPIMREAFAEGSLNTHFKKVDKDGRRYRVRTVNGKDYVYYADQGRLIGSVWNDISSMSANSPILRQSTGYPTQKPEKLLDRIITACSRPDDLVLDCFCGSGTTAAVAEKRGRRWIACDLGRFVVHTTRKRLLEIPGVKPFVVQNLGKYERQAWMTAEFEKPEDRAATEEAYRRFILDLYRADSIAGHTWLHGVKSGHFVHVGAVDAPITLADVKAIAREVWRLAGKSKDVDGQTAAADVLGWEFAFELNELARQIAAEARVDVRFKYIPRDVLDRKAIEQGDIQAEDFFELRVLSTKMSVAKRVAFVELSDIMMPAEDLPEEVSNPSIIGLSGSIIGRSTGTSRAIPFTTNGSHTAPEPRLKLAAKHEYKEPGTYAVVVKVIDLLGCDTTRLISIQVQ